MTIINQNQKFITNDFNEWINIFTKKHYWKLHLESLKNKNRIDNILNILNDIKKWAFKMNYNEDINWGDFNIYTEAILSYNPGEQLANYRYKKLNNKSVILDILDTINSIDWEDDNIFLEWLGSYMLFDFIKKMSSKNFKNITIYMNLTSFWFYSKILKLFKQELLIKDYMIEKESLYIEIKL